MFLRFGMRALQLALGIACLAVVYAGIAPVLRAGPISDADIPSIEAPAEKDRSVERYRVIAARNLFHSRVSTPIAPVTEEIAESALRLKLCGTYAAQPAEHSVACIDDQNTQKRRAYRVGQEVSPGVKLIEVGRRRAVIDNQGTREQLRMEDAPAADAGAARPTAPARAAPAAASGRASAPRLSERLRQLRERANAAPSAAPQPPGPSTVSKLQTALDGAQLLPVYDEVGTFGGVRLSGINPSGPFAGMPENTICFEINGTRLDAVQTLPTELATSTASQACLRCRQPDGSETTRCL